MVFKKFCCICILSIISQLPIIAQTNSNKKITINGYLTDSRNAEKLINATVYISELQVGASTNSYGFYSITIPATENITLNYSYVGFETQTKEVDATKNLTLNIALIPKKILKEVKIIAKKKVPIQQNTQMSVASLPISQIKSLPVFMGEVDVLKALQLLPGVQGGTEGSAGIYVRGGGPDQNLFLLDGVPVYNVNHLGGFFSTFNADAISNVDLYKGGFPARFGGRLSSVVDIRMKEGNKKKLHGEGGIGIISSRLLLEGPINKGKGSFMVSGRRTYFDILLAPIIKAQTNGASKGGYFFYDFNAKFNYKLGEKDHIYASGYFGRDKFFIANTDNFNTGSSTFGAGLSWGNLTGVLRWNHLFNAKTFGNLRTSISTYDFTTNASTQETSNTDTVKVGLKLFSGIKDVNIKYDVDYHPNPKNTIKFGVSATNQVFTPNANSFKFDLNGTANDVDTNYSQNVIKAINLDAYVEDDLVITKKWKANLGLHFGGFIVQNNFYKSIQPRVSMRYLINDDYSIKASYAQMNQFINLLSFDGVGLPTDLWVPVTDKIKPQNSKQVALGAAGTVNKMYEVSVETYYKSMKNIIDYKDGSSYLTNQGSYEDIVEMGIGKSYGAEFLLQKKEGKLQGLISYGLASTQRKYPTINNGNWFYYKYDRRHDFKIAGIYKISEKVEASANWVFNTGSWNTLPTLTYNPQPPGYNAQQSFNFNQLIQYFPSRNNFNMMNYHRLDFGFRFTKQKKYYQRTWALGCYNTYSRKNPFFIFLGNDNMGKPAYKQFCLFGFPLPYLTYSFKF
jgi:outer membrane cobalamin receptor